MLAKKIFYACVTWGLLLSLIGVGFAHPTHRFPVHLAHSTTLVNYTPDGVPVYDPTSGNTFATIFTGGTYNQGAVYAILNDGGQAIMSSFGVSKYDGQGPIGGLVSVNDGFYGATAKGGAYGDGTIFVFVQTGPTNGQNQIVYSFNKNISGGRPTGLTLSSGLLCGITTTGAGYGYGAYFCFNPFNSEFQVIYSFPN